MTINEYQIEAYKTAIYKDKVVYPTLGLINEVGEFLEKYFESDNYKTDDIIHEIGDILWYLAALCSDLDITLSSLYSEDFYELNILYFEASMVAGIIKKWMRDSERVFSVEKMFELKAHLSKIFLSLHTYLIDIDYHLEEVFRLNIEKLNSRKERGVIQGSGDHR
jgi:NTP pyrophosphatase (non-canonical NTP hydrolase)